MIEQKLIPRFRTLWCHQQPRKLTTMTSILVSIHIIKLSYLGINTTVFALSGVVLKAKRSIDLLYRFISIRALNGIGFRIHRYCLCHVSSNSQILISNHFLLPRE